MEWNDLVVRERTEDRRRLRARLVALKHLSATRNIAARGWEGGEEYPMSDKRDVPE